jgi:hypothetical protein
MVPGAAGKQCIRRNLALRTAVNQHFCVRHESRDGGEIGGAQEAVATKCGTCR